MPKYGAPLCANRHLATPMIFSYTDSWDIEHFFCPQCKKKQQASKDSSGAFHINDEI